MVREKLGLMDRLKAFATGLKTLFIWIFTRDEVHKIVCMASFGLVVSKYVYSIRLVSDEEREYLLENGLIEQEFYWGDYGSDEEEEQ